MIPYAADSFKHGWTTTGKEEKTMHSFTADIEELLENRLGEVMDDLLRQKGEYTMAWEQSRELYGRIDPIVNHEEDLSISGGDCLNLRDYLEAEGKAAGLLQGALYRQMLMQNAAIMGPQVQQALDESKVPAPEKKLFLLIRTGISLMMYHNVV